MHIVHTVATAFDGRALAKTLPSQVIGGWSREAVIEEAALCWLNDNRFRAGNRGEPIFPEAESLGARDVVILAGLVSKIGVERFGKALDEDLDINRLSAAVRRGRFNIDKFVTQFDSGVRDPRYFGAVQAIAPKAVYRDKSGFTRREKLEMGASYALDRERLDFAGMKITDDDLLRAREDQALWPASEQLEADGIDIVALERARSAIGTQALAGLYAAGFNLYTLAMRVRNGLDAQALVQASYMGLKSEAFNSSRFPVSTFHGGARQIEISRVPADSNLSSFEQFPINLSTSVQ